MIDQYSLIKQYQDHLPLEPGETIVSLQEGRTPLYAMPRLASKIGGEITLYCKFEGANPTGSFKDRGMTMAVTKALAEGKQTVICASTGNTSASAAAYAAKAGLRAVVLIPAGKIAFGKLAQALAYGASVIQIEGNFDQGLKLVRELAKEKGTGLALVNSVNPYRLQGQKTIAFEVVDELGCAPDYHCLPVGNAGNISAHWMGYTEYEQRGHCQKRPIIAGYQAAGAAPFVEGHPIKQPETLATAIRIGSPASWELACEAQQASGGWFAAVSDEDILAAQRLIAETEGVFCEPASAASIAGLKKDLAQGKITPGSLVVCTLTGNGMKDPDIITQRSQERLIKVPAEVAAIRAYL